MVVQHATSSTFGPNTQPAKCREIPRCSAKLAHGMAHKKVAAYRRSREVTAEDLGRRRLFLVAAIDFRPDLEREYQKLRPLALEAASAIRAAVPDFGRHETVRWGDVAQLGEIAAADHAQWSALAPVADLRRELLAWAEKWHLLPSANNSWVLGAATLYRCNTTGSDPVPLQVPPLPEPDSWTLTLPALELGQAEAAWREQVAQLFERAVREHVADRREYVAGVNEMATVPGANWIDKIEPIAPLRRETRQHHELAARWQVGSETWTDFLVREGLVNRKSDHLKSVLWDVLASLEIAPRPLTEPA